MPYKINDPVCVKEEYNTRYGRIISIKGQDCYVLFQNGSCQLLFLSELSPADPLQCLMVGDKIKNQFNFLTVEGVSGNVVFYSGKNHNCQGDKWQKLKEQDYSLINSTSQEDIVEKYAKDIWEQAGFVGGFGLENLKQKLNQFKEEIR